ncbi:unnamed protein product [Candida verbasci]|uniref:Uncharacterized protein n=1 Tax=Candida verbasci TaxID=1227364 RepID=A0A9W4TU49_9ASCO|nr:unnamed protein product [Candida verbasci]
MPTIPVIPGFYYDATKKRYFKITNGAIENNESSSKYHNNYIQQEKRHLKYDDDDDDDINNLKIKKIKISNKSRNDSQFKMFNLNSMGLINLKSGVVNLSNLYYFNDLIDGLKQSNPTYIPELVMKGIVLTQYKDYLLVFNKYIENHQIMSNSSPIKLQNIVKDEVTQIIHEWYVCYNSNIIEKMNLKQLGDIGNAVNFDMNVYQDCFDDKILMIMMVYKVNGYLFLTFNVIDDCIIYDYSDKLMKFLKVEISKIKNKKNKHKRRLFSILGLLKVEFPSYESKSMEDINKLLNLIKSNDISEILKVKYQKEIDKFIFTQNGDKKPEVIYKLGDPLKDYVDDIVTIKIKNSKIIILTSMGDIITFNYDIKNTTFSNFKYLPSRLTLSSNIDIQTTENNDFYFNTSTNLYKLSKNKLTSIYRINTIRKFFLLNDQIRVIIITMSEIYVYNLKYQSIYKLDNYFNDNNPHQIFKMFENFLVFNINENEFMIYNLNRISNNKTKFKIDFNFQKLGYLKNFKLVEIIEMKGVHKLLNHRLRLGFTFCNKYENVTIFETYVL